jgi:hypothetical protein
MVLNPNFNNISAISWRSVLLVEETEVHGKNHRPAASHLQPLSHYVELSKMDENSRPRKQAR